MMLEVEKIFSSLSFVLQDIIFPIAGYFKNFTNSIPDTLSIKVVQNDIFGAASMDDWMYVNPVTIYPTYYNRVVDRLGLTIPPSQSNYVVSAQVIGDNSSKVSAIDYRKGYVLFSAQPVGPVTISYGAKTVKFITTPPNAPDKIIPPQIALVYDSTGGSGGAIGSAAKFMTDNFFFDVWGRNDTEVMRLGNLMEHVLRVSIPVINFEVSGYPLAKNQISGKGLEPQSFNPVANTIKWARLNVVSFQKLDFPGATDADRFRGTGRIEITTVR